MSSRILKTNDVISNSGNNNVKNENKNKINKTLGSSITFGLRGDTVNSPIVLHAATAKCWTPDWFWFHRFCARAVSSLMKKKILEHRNFNCIKSKRSKIKSSSSIQLEVNNNRNFYWMHYCPAWKQVNSIIRIASHPKMFYFLPQAIMTSIIHNNFFFHLFLGSSSAKSVFFFFFCYSVCECLLIFRNDLNSHFWYLDWSINDNKFICTIFVVLNLTPSRFETWCV